MTDMSHIRCFTCGEYGHLKRACPSKPESRRDRASSPVSEHHKAACYTAPMPPQRALEDIADYKHEAAKARAILSDALGRPLEAEPYVITPFRQAMKLPPRTEADLREIALQQVQESRALADRAVPARPEKCGTGWPGSR